MLDGEVEVAAITVRFLKHLDMSRNNFGQESVGPAARNAVVEFVARVDCLVAIAGDTTRDQDEVGQAIQAYVPSRQL
jgi:hypothetical protein